MANLQELKEAITVLEGTDIEAVKKALAIVGEPVASPASTPTGLPFEVGKSYLIRTVTYFQTGKVTDISGGFIALSDASHVFETGNMTDSLKSGTFSETEYVGNSFISINAVVDAFELTGAAK